MRKGRLTHMWDDVLVYLPFGVCTRGEEWSNKRLVHWSALDGKKSGSGLANAWVYANADQPQLSKDSCSYLCEGVPVCTAVG